MAKLPKFLPDAIFSEAIWFVTTLPCFHPLINPVEFTLSNRFYLPAHSHCSFSALVLILASFSECTAQDKLKPGRLPSEIRKSLVPGLLIETFAADGQTLLDIERRRLPALMVKPDEHFSPFVEKKNVMIRFSGYVKLKLKGTYQLSIQGSGKVQLLVNKAFRLSTQDLNNPVSKQAELVKGYNSFELLYFPPESGNAKLRVYWEHESIAKEPIPSTVFYSSNQVNFRTDSATAEKSFSHFSQLHSGRQLFLNHNCQKCHSGPAKMHPFYAEKDAPDLAISGGRLDNQWLQQWLLKPSLLRNQTTMPQMFGSGSAKEVSSKDSAAVADLAAFVQSVGTKSKNELKDLMKDSHADKGGDIFENLGCIGCHHFSEPESADEYDRISLHFAAAKFRSGRLAEFLLDSRAHYRWSRMPQFRLTPEQATNLEAFIREESKGQLIATSSKSTPDIENGKRLFSTTGCTNCHPLKVAPKTLAAPNWQGANPTQGCLAAEADRKQLGRVPHFGFNGKQLSELQSFIQSRSLESISRINRGYFAVRALKQLRCISCHDLDHEQATLPYIIEEEGAVGLPPNRVPMLTYAGEKLQPEWSEKLITGKLPYRVREHFRVQMPGFPERGKLIAQGLSASHGFERRENSDFQPNTELTRIGNAVAAMESGLSCNRCHAIADKKPNAAFDAQSTNLVYAARRLRKEYYLRWMLDPLRIDKQTKMPRFSEDRESTSLKSVANGDAKQQFEALWHYLNSIKR